MPANWAGCSGRCATTAASHSPASGFPGQLRQCCETDKHEAQLTAEASAWPADATGQARVLRRPAERAVTLAGHREDVKKRAHGRDSPHRQTMQILCAHFCKLQQLVYGSVLQYIISYYSVLLVYSSISFFGVV